MYLQGLGEISASSIGYINNTAYGKSPEIHSQFKNLQKTLNRFAKLAGFSTLTVDGKLGSLTTYAVKKTANYVSSKGIVSTGGVSGLIAFPAIFMAALNAASSKDYAKWAVELTEMFNTVANNISAPKATTGPLISAPAYDAADPMPVIDSGFPIPMNTASLGLGALALFFLFKGKKGRKGGKRRRTSGRRRRRR